MKFFNVILLKKNKTIKEKTFSSKDNTFNLQDLIDSKLIKKKKKPLYCFTLHDNNYHFIGLTKGKEKNINQHELPPPIDTKFFYGNIFVIKTTKKQEYQHFTVKDFNKVYEELFGGFESLGSYDTETDSEGYVKITEEDYDPNVSEEENKVDYDKFYKEGSTTKDDDSFIVTTSQDINNSNNSNNNSTDDKEPTNIETSSNEYTDYTSFHTEDETESDEEIKEYLEENLYDSDE